MSQKFRMYECMHMCLCVCVCVYIYLYISIYVYISKSYNSFHYTILFYVYYIILLKKSSVCIRARLKASTMMVHTTLMPH